MRYRNRVSTNVVKGGTMAVHAAIGYLLASVVATHAGFDAEQQFYLTVIFIGAAAAIANAVKGFWRR